MAGEFDQITNAIKVGYPQKSVSAMVNAETPFRNAIKKDIPAGARLEEGIIKLNATFNPPQNVGQTADGGDLPTPKNRTEDLLTVNPTLFVASLQIGAITRAAAKSGKSAFAAGGEVMRRTEETLADHGKYVEQTYLMTHGTGRRAIVATPSGDGVNTFQVAQPEGVRGLRENFIISMRTTDGGATVVDSIDNRTITAIDRATRTVSYSGADQTAVAGSHVHVVIGANQTGLTTLSAMGLRGIVDDGTYLGTYFGLSRTTYPKLKANVLSGSGTPRNLTEQLLIQGCHEARDQSGKKITHCYTGPGQAEKYVEFVAADRRFFVPQGSKKPQAMVTGYGDLIHVFPGGDFLIQISYDIVPGELFLLNMETFFHYLAQDTDWWDEGGMLKQTPTSGGYKASFVAYLRSVENLCSEMPIANVVIRDLKDRLAGTA
jgi:hypothetical protein